jgi:hypothetical protein
VVRAVHPQRARVGSRTTRHSDMCLVGNRSRAARHREHRARVEKGQPQDSRGGFAGHEFASPDSSE